MTLDAVLGKNRLILNASDSVLSFGESSAVTIVGDIDRRSLASDRDRSRLLNDSRRGSLSARPLMIAYMAHWGTSLVPTRKRNRTRVIPKPAYTGCIKSRVYFLSETLH